MCGKTVENGRARLGYRWFRRHVPGALDDVQGAARPGALQFVRDPCQRDDIVATVDQRTRQMRDPRQVVPNLPWPEEPLVLPVMPSDQSHGQLGSGRQVLLDQRLGGFEVTGIEGLVTSFDKNNGFLWITASCLLAGPDV